MTSDTPLEMLCKIAMFFDDTYDMDDLRDAVAACVQHNMDINDATSDLTPLMAACTNTNLEVVEYLLQNGADVNFHSRDGSTALHSVAASCKDVALVKLLLAHGANMSAKDNSDRAPVHWLFEIDYESRGDPLGVLLALIDAGMDLRITVHGESLLQLACRTGWGDFAEVFVDHGVDVNFTAKGSTVSPLSSAVSSGYVYPARLVLKHGADAEGSFHDGTPLLQGHYTNGEASISMMKLLIEYGHDLVEADQAGPRVLHTLLGDSDHFTKVGSDVYEFILDQGVPVNGLNEQEQTPLHVVCSGRFDLQLSLMQLLLRRGAKDALTMQDASGYLPLHCAAKAIPTADRGPDDTACLAQLLAYGADPNATTRVGLSAMSLLFEMIRLPRHDAKDISTYYKCARELCARGASWDGICERRLQCMETLMWTHVPHYGVIEDETARCMAVIVRSWKAKFQEGTDREFQNPLLLLSGLRGCINLWSDDRWLGSTLPDIPSTVYCQGEASVVAWLRSKGLVEGSNPAKRRKI